MTLQLPLVGIGLTSSASFANYVPATDNQAIPRIMQEVISGQGESCLYLWGEHGTGKSHLLQAACQQISQQGGTPVYLPLATFSQHSPDILEDLDALDLICLDDLQAIIGLNEWERAVFRLFNVLREAHIPLLMAAHTAPKQLGLHLPDLISRLSWGGVFSLTALDQDGLIHALQKHAQERGLELSTKVARYLIDRSPHDMATLIEWLQILDYASLSARRKLTLPFVREVLQQQLLLQTKQTN